MDPRFLDVLHDPRDVDRIAVADGVDIDLDGVAQVAVDQHRVVAGNLDGLGHVAAQADCVVDDLHAPATQHVRRTQQDRITDGLSHRLNVFRRAAEAVGRLLQADVVEQPLEAFTILSKIDGIR
ncbi:MAG: Uncharacterised protein [Rhodospirillaceae bacterium]|nr:MAG: Uncharacterised protein [Rhodospirillaceae bacterium]